MNFTQDRQPRYSNLSYDVEGVISEWTCCVTLGVIKKKDIMHFGLLRGLVCSDLLPGECTTLIDCTVSGNLQITSTSCGGNQPLANVSVVA